MTGWEGKWEEENKLGKKENEKEQITFLFGNWKEKVFPGRILNNVM